MKRSKRDMNKTSESENIIASPVAKVKKDKRENNNENIKNLPTNSTSIINKTKKKERKNSNVENVASRLNTSASSVAERTKNKRACNKSPPNTPNTPNTPGSPNTPGNSNSVSNTRKDKGGNTESTKGIPKTKKGDGSNTESTRGVLENSPKEGPSTSSVKKSKGTKTKKDFVKHLKKKKERSLKKRGRPLKHNLPPCGSTDRSLISDIPTDDKANDVNSNVSSTGNEKTSTKVSDDSSLSPVSPDMNIVYQSTTKTMIVSCPRLSIRARLRSASPPGGEDSIDSKSEGAESHDSLLEVSMDKTDIEAQTQTQTDEVNISLLSDTTVEENTSMQEETMEYTTTVKTELNDTEEIKENKKKQTEQKENNDNIALNPEPEQVNESTSNIEDDLQILNIGEGDNLEILTVGQEDNLEIVNVGEDNLEIVNVEVEEEMYEEFPLENVRYISVDLHDDFHGILMLAQHQIVAIHGCMQLGVILGEVDIAGYKSAASVEQEEEVQYADVYSPTTSSLLYIKDLTTTAPCLEAAGKLVTDLSTIFKTTSEKIVEVLGDIQNITSCVVVKKSYSLLPAVLKKLENFNGFPTEPEFMAQPFDVAVLDTESWNVVVDEILTEMWREDGCLCSIMLCGVGNVGKSSLARYVVNRMLAEHGSVYFLDCDCGQTEFTPPSCLSLVKVTKPLLGPPFSHQLTPVASYFYGHISPGETPSEYIKLIGNLFHIYYRDHHCEGPLVINTQGWMQGLGLSLLVDCIRLTSPCHIVHIISPAEKRNVPIHLSDELLQEEKGWYYDSSYKCMKSGHGCTYHHLPVTEVQTYYSNMQRKNKSRVSRDQSVTSYFSSLYQPFLDHHLSKGKKFNDWIPPSVSVLMPFVVRWKDVALHIMHTKVTNDVMLFGFNLALVGLARVDPELIKPGEEDSDELRFLLDQPVAEYIGFGIVRNIDPTNKLFYILTPVPKEKLENVNALLRGSAQLPTSYFLEDKDSNRPYYCADYINVASKTASSMKPRYNLKRKPSKIKSGD